MVNFEYNWDEMYTNAKPNTEMIFSKRPKDKMVLLWTTSLKSLQISSIPFSLILVSEASLRLDIFSNEQPSLNIIKLVLNYLAFSVFIMTHSSLSVRDVIVPKENIGMEQVSPR